MVLSFSRVRIFSVLCGAVVCAGLLAGSTAFADNNFQVSSGLWNDPLNWSAGHVPAAANEITAVVGGRTAEYNSSMGTTTFGNSGKEFHVGDGRAPLSGSNPTDILNVTGGTLNHNVGSETIVGYGFGQPCNSYLNVSGAGQFLTNGILTLGWLGADATHLSNGHLNLSTGGTASAATLSLGSGTNGIGYLDVAATGGSFAAPTIRVGYDGGTGHVTQGGGTVTASTALHIGYGFSTGAHLYGVGDYVLSGGTLKALTILSTTTTGTGTLLLNGGTLQAYSTSSNWMQDSANLTVKIQSGGVTMDSNGAANATVNKALLEDAASTGGGLTKVGAGTLVLNGLNTYTGGTIISDGTLQTAVVGTLGATSGKVNIAAGATLDLGQTSQTTGAVTLAGGTIRNGTLNGSSVAATGGVISAALAGSGGLAKTGAGTLTVSGASSYSGGTTLGAGTIVVGASGTAGLNIPGGYKIAACGDSITDGPTLAQAWPAALQSQLQNRMGNTNITVTNYGYPGATAIADGRLPYNSLSKYTDAINSNPNTVVIQLGTNDTNVSNGDFAKASANGYADFVNSLTNLVNSFKNTANHPLVWLCLPPTIYNPAPGDNEANLDLLMPYIRQVATATGSGLIDNNTALQNQRPGLYYDDIHPNAAGEQWLGLNIYSSLASTYFNNGPLGTGLLTVNGGVLSDDGNARTLTNSLAITGNVTFASTGSGSLTFDPTGLTTPSTVTLSNTPTLNVTNTTTIKEAIGGSGFTKAGAGVLVLGATNTYSGATAISAGTLALAVGGSIANSSAVNIGKNGTFDVSAASYALISNQTVTFELDGAFGGSAGLLNAGNLNIANGTVDFSVVGVLDDPWYVFAKYRSGGLTGTAFASVLHKPGNYRIDYNYQGLNEIALVAVPEPSTLTLLALACGLTLACRWSKRK